MDLFSMLWTTVIQIYFLFTCFLNTFKILGSYLYWNMISDSKNFGLLVLASYSLSRNFAAGCHDDRWQLVDVA